MNPRRLLFILGGLLAGAALTADIPPPKDPPHTSAPPTPETRIYFSNTTINGQPARLVLDTGSDSTMLYSSTTDKLGLKVTPPSPASKSLPGRISPGLSEPAQLTVGAQTFTVQFPVESGLYTHDGVIGWPEVRDDILVFDAPGRMVKAVAELPAETAGWMKLKIHVGVHLILDAPRPDGKTDTVLVDTGAIDVALPPAQWKEWRLAHPQATSTMRTYSMAAVGTVTTEEAWADEITIGGITLTHVPVREANGTELASSPNFAGSLGIYALKRMDLIVDGKSGFAYLHPKPPPDPAIKPADADAGAAPPSTENDDWTVSNNVRLSDNQLRAHAYIFDGVDKGAKNDLAGAIADLNDALELDPQNVQALFDRGVAKSRKNDLNGAIADFTRALELDPQNITVCLERAANKEKTGDFNGSIADCDHALELDPQKSQAYVIRGVDREKKGDLDGALADYTRALELDPAGDSTYLIRGGVRETKGDFAGAIADYTRAIEINPKSINAWIDRGIAEGRKGDFTAALADLDRAVELDPQSVLATVNRGITRQSKGDYDGALADYTRVLELDPKHFLAYYNRGNVRQIQGDFAAAVSDYDRAIALNPGGANAPRLYRQVLLARLGRPPEDFAKTIAGWKTGWSKTTGQFLVGSLSETDFLAATIKGDATTIRTQQCVAFYFAGMMRLSKGDLGSAHEFWQKCLATGLTNVNEYLFAHAELARLDAAQSPAPSAAAPAAASK